MFLQATRPADDKIIFLAAPPYIRKKTKNDYKKTETPTVFTETQDRLIAHLLRWSMQHGVVKYGMSNTQLLPDVDKNVASFSYIMHCYNFQRMVCTQDLENFITAISDNAVHFTTTALHQLTISLFSLYTAEFIEHHMNQIYGAFISMPLPDADYTWAEVHKKYPFMWVVLSLHIAIKNFTERDPIKF